MTLALSVIFAVLLDRVFSEPKRYHPLIGFGRYVSAIEKRCFAVLTSASKRASNPMQRGYGVLAVVFAIGPWLMLALMLDALLLNIDAWPAADSMINGLLSPLLNVLLGGAVLYLAIGWQSLLAHAKQVAKPLAKGDITQAREYVSWIVSRDTAALDETEVAKAATESVLENGADAIFAAVFWFCVLGIPGVVLYRCANTLDAMWGYKNDKYRYFGWAAARLDDVLNYLPARITALSYVVLAKSGYAIQAFNCWRSQGYLGKSPNAGPVMAAGAGALNVSLGGAASYHNRIEQKPVLGPQQASETQADAKSIIDACDLINRTLLLWVLVLLGFSIFFLR